MKEGGELDSRRKYIGITVDATRFSGSNHTHRQIVGSSGRRC